MEWEEMQATRTAAGGTQSVWVIDPTHTSVAFSVENFFFFKVRGKFEDVAGTVVLDEEGIRQSSVTVTIKAASITTGIKRRDAHLRTGDFLDVDRYPNILFQSTLVERGRDRDMLRMVGTLTIRDMSREVALDVAAVDRSCSPQGEEVVYYTATTELDRFDFGIKYGRGVIGRKVKAVINVQALRQR
jgi:polyisoprenoid-binding protein YceI